MLRSNLSVGVDYMTYSGADPLSAYDVQRFRLLSTQGVDVSTDTKAPGLDIETDAGLVHVPSAEVAADGIGTDLVFAVVDPKTGQETGQIILLTPDQIMYQWDEGANLIATAYAEQAAEQAAIAAAAKAMVTLAKSASGRIANLIPSANSTVVPSSENLLGVVVDADTLNAVLDLAQRAVFGSV